MNGNRGRRQFAPGKREQAKLRLSGNYSWCYQGGACWDLLEGTTHSSFPGADLRRSPAAEAGQNGGLYSRVGFICNCSCGNTTLRDTATNFHTINMKNGWNLFSEASNRQTVFPKGHCGNTFIFCRAVTSSLSQRLLHKVQTVLIARFHARETSKLSQETQY